MRTYFTYILTNKKYGVLYTGMTNDIYHRTIQHKNKINKGFTSRYNLNKLVWFEQYQWVHDAIFREKQIKGWNRDKKIKLIESMNPEWKGLFLTL